MAVRPPHPASGVRPTPRRLSCMPPCHHLTTAGKVSGTLAWKADRLFRGAALAPAISLDLAGLLAAHLLFLDLLPPIPYRSVASSSPNTAVDEVSSAHVARRLPLQAGSRAHSAKVGCLPAAVLLHPDATLLPSWEVDAYCSPGCPSASHWPVSSFISPATLRPSPLFQLCQLSHIQVGKLVKAARAPLHFGGLDGVARLGATCCSPAPPPSSALT